MTLVRLGILGLLAAVGGESQELRQDQKAVVKSLLRGRLSLGSSVALALRQGLFELRLLCSGARAVLLIDFLVLSQLFLILSKLSLERRFLENLGFLVGIDDFLGDQVVKALVGMLGAKSIDFGGVGLGTTMLASRIVIDVAGQSTHNLLVDVPNVPVRKCEQSLQKTELKDP